MDGDLATYCLGPGVPTVAMRTSNVTSILEIQIDDDNRRNQYHN